MQHTASLSGTAGSNNIYDVLAIGCQIALHNSSSSLGYFTHFFEISMERFCNSEISGLNSLKPRPFASAAGARRKVLVALQ
jgi:hypothetical protein